MLVYNLEILSFRDICLYNIVEVAECHLSLIAVNVNNCPLSLRMDKPYCSFYILYDWEKWKNVG